MHNDFKFSDADQLSLYIFHYFFFFFLVARRCRKSPLVMPSINSFAVKSWSSQPSLRFKIPCVCKFLKPLILDTWIVSVVSCAGWLRLILTSVSIWAIWKTGDLPEYYLLSRSKFPPLNFVNHTQLRHRKKVDVFFAICTNFFYFWL